MQRKIFIAIDFDDRAKNFIEKKVDKIKEKLNARWVDKQNYHITLSFLGYLEDDDLVDLILKIKEVLLDFNIFDIHLSKIILAPDSNNPKMVWLSGQKNNQLINLRHKIEQIINKTETCLSADKIEKKEFRPHVNLGKIKGTAAKKEAVEKVGEIERGIDLLIPVTGVKIFESKIEKRRQQYLTVDSIEFN